MKFGVVVTSLLMFAVMTVLTGFIYPFVMTSVSGIVAPSKSRGSLVYRADGSGGSALIGQQFTSPGYFHSRPSAVDYSPMPSSGTNWGPTADTLARLVRDREKEFRVFNGLSPADEVPREMLFASGSGLDPHISPEAARLQMNRVAAARGWSESRKHALGLVIDRLAEPPQFMIFGEPRVNVLMLNLAVDSLARATGAD